jgi:hypothetical protein
MATNAFLIAIRIDGKDTAREEIIRQGLQKLADACRTPEGLQQLVGKGMRETAIFVLRNVPSIRTLDVQPNNRAAELMDHCRAFVYDHEIRCAEAIYQKDEVGEEALEFIEGICDIIGFDKSKEQP